jgi:glycosyltransferase involved in cell wall biosynthesis
MAQIRLTVVIPTHNRAHMLPETLDSLGYQTRMDFEVIVVCDGDDPQTRAFSERYLAKFPLTWIFVPEKKGLPSARNTGARSATGNLIAFLDDDMTVVPDWVLQHTRHQPPDNTSAGLVVCGKTADMYLYSASSHIEHFFRESRASMLRMCEGSMAAQNSESVRVDSYAIRYFGANCSIDCDRFLACGGFDPILRLSEEMEMGQRLFDLGFQFVFEPQAMVHHRETKEQKKYLVQCWKDRGHADVYRARAKGQRNPQTRGLTFVRSQRPWRKFRARLSFDYPKSVRTMAQAFRWATDLTGSRMCFRAWAGLESSADYWEEVSSELTQDSLFRLVGWPFGVMRFRAIDAFVDPKEKDYHLSDARFSRLLDWLKALGSKFLPPEAATLGSTVRHGVILSFDGGYEGLYHHLLPKLDGSNIVPVVFLVPKYIGKTSVWDDHIGHRPRKLLSIAQIREMQSCGVQFGSQGMTHLGLIGVSNNELHWEVEASKSRLEDILGAEVTYFAYPWGASDTRVRAAVARAGYRVAFSGRPGLDHWDDKLSLKRVTVRESDGLVRLLAKMFIDRWAFEEPAIRVDSRKRLHPQMLA